MANRIPSSVQKDTTQPQPNGDESPLGVRWSQKELALRCVSDWIADLHAALGAAVKARGGVTKFGNTIGRSHGDVSLRVRRAQDSKGQVQRADFDFAAEAVSSDGAHIAFVDELLRRWGRKQSEPLMPTVPDGEALDAVLSVLEEAGEVGSDVIRRAAARAGVDQSAIRRRR